MLVALGWLLVLGPLHLSPPSQLAQSLPAGQRQQVAGRVSVWPERAQPYREGEEVRIYLRTEVPGHTTVLRVDTDGRLRALFPREPWRRSYVSGGRTREIAASHQRPAFTVDDSPGIGYLLAVTSPFPFEYEDVTRGDYWDFRLIQKGRIRGDPYVALTDLARRIAPRGSYRYDIAPYYVGRRYEYPRFVCYDCHSYASPDKWDPYATSCLRYRVVIYDDPAYYPYRYNQGGNVVTTRPLRPAPRYVFKDAEPDTEYVTRLRQRESHELRRSRVDRGRTSADVGGPGTIPAPGVGVHSWVPPALAEPQTLRRRRAQPPAEPSSVEAREPRKVPTVKRGARNPQSTGEPKLRRRKP